MAYEADQVFVCAGAIFSPALLLRSGIGAPDELREHGIQPVLERPGVGRNLQNHPVAYLATHIPVADRNPRTSAKASSATCG